jgi:ribosomal protein L34E
MSTRSNCFSARAFASAKRCRLVRHYTYRVSQKPECATTNRDVQGLQRSDGTDVERPGFLDLLRTGSL